MNPWASLSVRQFWQQFHWENRPLPSAPVVANGLSLTLSVGQYFARIPWEGPVVVAATPVSAPVVTAEPVEELATLEDFLGDISAFF